MNIRTRTTACLAGGAILAGSLFAATAADAGSPVPTPAPGTVSVASVVAEIQAAIAAGATPNVAPPVTTAGVSGTTVRTRSSRARGAAPSLTTSALALAAEIQSGVSMPCQYNADEPGSLLVFGNYPHATYVVQYSIHGVPVMLKTGKLTARGTSLKAVPMDWSNGDVKVWLGGTRCSHT
jgi:hypothetical protein